ncbi:hypothetical protein NDU88_002501 [Pleurodeles waltl]|uniref:Uncharacterized protein n=1 Tax=Pleurodeles waltl TaxID=8319 RepID=A0AAV7T2G1_PLEWA|nr:hypothetical protein NDU88_002501 [Pleurodeles waltl]
MEGTGPRRHKQGARVGRVFSPRRQFELLAGGPKSTPDSSRGASPGAHRFQFGRLLSVSRQQGPWADCPIWFSFAVSCRVNPALRAPERWPRQRGDHLRSGALNAVHSASGPVMVNALFASSRSLGRQLSQRPRLALAGRADVLGVVPAPPCARQCAGSQGELNKFP